VGGGVAISPKKKRKKKRLDEHRSKSQSQKNIFYPSDNL